MGIDQTLEAELTPGGPSGRVEPFRIAVNVLVTAAAALAAFSVISVFTVQLVYMPRIRERIGDVPKAPVAIILGASVKKDGTPSPALEDRIMSGVDLYRAGTVETLLMTGDDGAFHIDEISVMKRVAIEAGVPETAIWTDPHGYRTYESCKRAITVFGVKNAVVVTQRFHLGRALFLCNQLGIDATGFAADRREYEGYGEFWLRDFASSVKAFYDIYITPPKSPVSYE
jgi:vancomycin permeability regulator SanA